MRRTRSEPAEVHLILGGARSGKSAFAQRLATQLGEPVLFVATAQALDPEMAARIAVHRAERPPDWQTLEAPAAVADAIRHVDARPRTILLDCLTLLVSNRLGDVPDDAAIASIERDLWSNIEVEVSSLLYLAAELACQLIVVSNEVGLGLVPPYPSGRLFRDLLGRANQRVAASARAVYLMVAGIPVDVKVLAGLS